MFNTHVDIKNFATKMHVFLIGAYFYVYLDSSRRAVLPAASCRLPQ